MTHDGEWAPAVVRPPQPDRVRPSEERLANGLHRQRMTVALVRFASGARTARHSHARRQYIRVTSRIARFGGREGNVWKEHITDEEYEGNAA